MRPCRKPVIINKPNPANGNITTRIRGGLNVKTYIMCATNVNINGNNITKQRKDFIMANGEYKITNDGEYVIDDTPDIKLERCPKCQSTDIS